MSNKMITWGQCYDIIRIICAAPRFRNDVMLMYLCIKKIFSLASFNIFDIAIDPENFLIITITIRYQFFFQIGGNHKIGDILSMSPI